MKYLIGIMAIFVIVMTISFTDINVNAVNITHSIECPNIGIENPIQNPIENPIENDTCIVEDEIEDKTEEEIKDKSVEEFKNSGGS